MRLCVLLMTRAWYKNSKIKLIFKEAVMYRIADAPLTYGIVISVFIGLGVILFAARAKRYSSKTETHADAGSQEKRSPA
jgi:hypothetical protein